MFIDLTFNLLTTVGAAFRQTVVGIQHGGFVDYVAANRLQLLMK